MNITRKLLFAALIACSSLTIFSCKSKKAIAKPDAAPTAQTAPPVEEKKPTPPPAKEEEEKPEPVSKPNYSFGNIQFEFNSSVLKTASFTTLDNAVAEMKKDPSVKFVLNGHSSAEGTTEHNMSLSVDRANAVKSYLINAGIDTKRLAIKGYGQSKPVSSNDAEEGRMLNRRVEIKLN